MNITDHLRSFLEAATAGLKDDRELQLETSAELASHIEAAAGELRAGGLPEDQAAEQALKALGPATDIAADFVSANRKRMKLRARLQIAVRALVVPIAVFLALFPFFKWAHGFWQSAYLREDDARTFMPMGKVISAIDFVTSHFNQLSPDQQLVLRGDRSRATQREQQRAIWEAYPTNIVYLNNYITYLTSDYKKLGADAGERLAAYGGELKLAGDTEPDNALFHYLMAGKLLQESSAVIVRIRKPADTNQQEEMTLVISNALSFNQAMDEFKTALQKPYYRSYTKEMLMTRLSILGAPETLTEQIAQIGIAAGTLLPNMGMFRTLARTACLQAQRLAAEGHPDEARVLLEACPALAVHLYRDGFSLIEVLTAFGIIGTYSNQAPALYERMGDPAAAANARHQAGVISRPVAEWREKNKSDPGGRNFETEIRRKGGILAGLVIPNLGEAPSDKDYRSGRLIEYTVAERITVELIMLVLLMVLVASLVVTLRWRFTRGGASAPLLLLPGGKTALRIVLLGTLLPVAGFYLYTRCLPFSGRDFSLLYVWPKLLFQLTTLVALVIGVTAMLASDAVRRRCQCLDAAIPPQRFKRPVRAVFMALTGVALAGSLVPSAWLACDGGISWGGSIAAGVSALLAAYLLILGIAVFFRFLRGSSLYGLFYGTAARSLIPSLAVAMIFLSLMARSYLAAEETALVRCDPNTATMMNGDSFTAIEARLVQRLKQETLDAIRSLDMPQGSGATTHAPGNQTR